MDIRLVRDAPLNQSSDRLSYSSVPVSQIFYYVEEPKKVNCGLFVRRIRLSQPKVIRPSQSTDFTLSTLFPGLTSSNSGNKSGSVSIFPAISIRL